MFSAGRISSFRPKVSSLNRLRLSPRRFAKEAPALPSYIVDVPPTKLSVLDNKLRVATEESYGETATIGVFIDAGSVYEDEKTNGVAHFLEHMAFKGTSKRNRQALELEIENMGATVNAYTSREQTVYYAKVFKNDVPKAVELLSDIIQNSTYEDSYIERERGTILREMEEVYKDHTETVFDQLHAAAFQGNPLAWTILGPEQNIKSISRSDIQNYVKQNYQPHRMVIAGAGAVNHNELTKLADTHFGKLTNPNPHKPTLLLPGRRWYTGAQVVVSDETMDSVHVGLAVEGVSWSHPDYFAFMIIQSICGAWDRSIGGGKNLSSRLCETFATDNLGTSLASFSTCYNETGLFGFHFEAHKDKVDDAIFETLQEWVRIASYVTEAEVERAKNRVKASVLLAVDGTTPTAEDIGRQILSYGRRLSPAELFMRINSISVADVRRVASQYLEDVDPSVAAIGNTEHFPDYNYIRAWTTQRQS